MLATRGLGRNSNSNNYTYVASFGLGVNTSIIAVLIDIGFAGAGFFQSDTFAVGVS
jgi:hypothetical protein